MAKPVITATKGIINLLELGMCTSLFLHVYFIRCNKFSSCCSSVIWNSFCIYRFDCTLYANESLYFRKQYVNLINFLPYLNLMKCHLPFSLHTGYNNTTNNTKKNWSIKFLLIRKQVWQDSLYAHMNTGYVGDLKHFATNFCLGPKYHTL